MSQKREINRPRPIEKLCQLNASWLNKRKLSYLSACIRKWQCQWSSR